MFNIGQELTNTSTKISEAIGAINMYNAPIKALVLENYAEAIKSSPVFCKDAYDLIKINADTQTYRLDTNNPEDMKLCEELRKSTDKGRERGGTILYGKL